MLADEDVDAYIKISPCQEGADESACDVDFAAISADAKLVEAGDITVAGVTVGSLEATDVAEATDASAPVTTPGGSPSGSPSGEPGDEDADDDEEDGEDSANINKFFGIVAIALMIVANYI